MSAVAVLLAAAAAWGLTAPGEALGRLDRRSSTARPPVRGDRPRGGRRGRTDLTSALGELVAGLASGLATGSSPREVVADAATGLPGLESLAATARSPTGDVSAGLDELARQPGGSVAADLAALWRLAEHTGCPLLGPVQRLRDADRGAAAVRRELSAQLAGPRATARLLAGLPALGVVLGAGLGADPIGFLIGTAVGRTSLALGSVLVGLGLLWTRSLVRSVDPSPARLSGDIGRSRDDLAQLRDDLGGG